MNCPLVVLHPVGEKQNNFEYRTLSVISVA